ncbi:MAG: membrane dipeptidase [Clostridiales bacterium]|nr:membrane dipeptidase [Clostridiales bacterium]
MFVADAHCDTLYSIAVEGRSPADCAVTPARLAEGGVGLQTFAMFSGSGERAARAHENGRAMLAAIDRLGVPMHSGRLPDAPPDAPSGVLSIEGGEMIGGSLDLLAEFDDACRVRMLALTWNYENEIGFPAASGSDRGLKPFGRELLAEMGKRGVLPDVSHLNEAGFWEVAEHSPLPPIASHSNLKSLCGHARNLTRDQVRAIVGRGGFIGINFYANFLVDEGDAAIDDVVRHIDAIAELGGIGVLGFGSDFDGINRWPGGLGDPSRFPALIEALRRRGYAGEDLGGICGMNLWRLLKRAEAGA